MQCNLLTSLTSGEQATIRSIDAEEGLFQRMTAMGFRIGRQIELVRRASFSGPLHVRVGSTDVVLRQTEARRIQVSDTRPT